MAPPDGDRARHCHPHLAPGSPQPRVQVRATVCKGRKDKTKCKGTMDMKEEGKGMIKGTKGERMQ